MKQQFHRGLSALAALVTLSFATQALANDPFVAEAKQHVAAATAQQTVWDGPTTGPKLQPSKNVILLLPT